MVFRVDLGGTLAVSVILTLLADFFSFEISMASRTSEICELAEVLEVCLEFTHCVEAVVRLALLMWAWQFQI